MRVKVDNNQIYIVTREYSNFHTQTVDIEHRITTSEAIRLRQELDAAITSTHCTLCGKDGFGFVCPECAVKDPNDE